jgi:hypothetical protein
VHESCVRRCDDRRLGGRAFRRLYVDRERLVAAADRHHRVVLGNPHVGEDHETFRRCQRGRCEGLTADAVPERDVRVRGGRCLRVRPARGSGSAERNDGGCK